MCHEDTKGCACAVLSARPEGLPPAGLADLLRRAARLDAQTAAFRAGVITEAERVDAARKEGFSSTSAWLAALSGEPVPTCRSQIAVAEALEGMPATRQAFAAGEVSESRVKVLAQAQALAPGQFAQDEAALVARVAAAGPKDVPRVLAAWKREADPQAAEAEVEQLRGLRAVHLSPGWLGMVHLSGDLDPESGLTVTTALRSLAEPPALDPADLRTPAQRWADALVEVCRRYLDGTPGTGSSRPHVAITVPWDTLRQGHGIVDTAMGPIPAETARRLTCDATISGIILKDGMPVGAGEARRRIPPPLRRALDLRDRHCTHPGCDIPAHWCDAHHIIHWAQGGKTEISNLRLLCRAHHRTTHNHQPYPQRK